MIKQNLNDIHSVTTVMTHSTLKTIYIDANSGETKGIDWRLKQYKNGEETGMIYNNDCVDLVIDPEAENIEDKILYTYEEVEPIIPADAKDVKTVEEDEFDGFLFD